MSSTCAKCARIYVWQRLELVERMADAQVRALVTHWPDGVTIEVRRCTCGSCIARKTDAMGQSAPAPSKIGAELFRLRSRTQ